MENNEDLDLFSLSEQPSSPLPERKLRRIKRGDTVAECKSLFKALGSEGSDGQDLEEPSSGFDGFDEENELSLGFENGFDSGTKRTLDFDSVPEESDGDHGDQSREMETGDPITDRSGKQQLTFDEPEANRKEGEEEKKKKKQKKKRAESDDEMTESAASKRRATNKERREHLTQLRAESQRLLRESRDAAFKPAPLVQKPISSVLEKIRQRRLELSKRFVTRSTTSSVGGGDGFLREDMVELEAEDSLIKEKENDSYVEVASQGNLDTSCAVRSENTASHLSHKSTQVQTAADEEPKQTFRAPLHDAQDLFSDSQTNDLNDELLEEIPSSPKEVLAPSLLAMNLKLDSALPDDISSDEDENDKENIDPHLDESVDLPSPKGDPVKTFVDDEAEEEDDSDNDLHRFQDNDEEDEDSEDSEELRDMIATVYEEKQSDIEQRMELHQKLLNQQDAAKTENLMQKWGIKHRETNLLEGEEYEEGEEETEEFSDEDGEDLPTTNAVRMSIRKLREMIPQMFTDKDDMYISSDDEEADERHVKEQLSERDVKLLPPTEDARSKELFSQIKKVNNVPDNRRKAKLSSLSNTLLMGQKNSLSKSSFIGRGSNCSLPSSHKHGSSVVRSFIFEREDSNSRSTISMAEDSTDMQNQRGSRTTKTASAKFSYSQANPRAQNTTAEAETSSGASLLEILRRPSLKSSRFGDSNGGNSMVGDTHLESVFAAFKLEKKSIGSKSNMSIKAL